MRRLARYLLTLALLGLLALAVALVVPWPLRWLPVGLPAGGWSQGHLRFLPGPTLSWPSLTLPLADDSLHLDHLRIRARGLTALRAWWSGDAPLASGLTIDKVRWGRLGLQDLQGQLFLTGDTLRIDSLDAFLGDQKLSGYWRARRGGSTPVWTLTLAAEHLLVDTLWARLYPERDWQVGGRVRLQGQVSRSAAGTVRHQVSVSGGPLVLRDWPLAQALERSLPLGGLNPLRADSLRLELGGRRGSEVKMASLWWPQGRLDAQGLIQDPDRPGKGLDLNLLLEVDPAARQRLALPGVLDHAIEWIEDPDGVLRFRARARGSLEAPDLELDSRNQRRRVKQRLESALRKLLGD